MTTITAAPDTEQLTPAQLQKKANLKAAEFPYPSDRLTGTAWREAYDAYLAWEAKGYPCNHCGAQIGRGYDGPSDRTLVHFFDNIYEGNEYCHPELRDHR